MKLIAALLIFAGTLTFLDFYHTSKRKKRLSKGLSSLLMILLGITALTLDFLPNNDQSSPEPARTEKSDNSSLSSSSSRRSSVSRSQNGSRQASSSASSQANENTSQAGLANLSYQGQQVITVNENQPFFSKNELSLAQGSWQRYGNLDRLNRVSQADALLNQDLMPQAERERLYVQPTGWHNKKVNGTWLYNRSHLIGYQLTGQNNNLRNLMTGTRSLNDPGMTTYENQIARYLHQSPSHYVRYSVTPIFRADELVARGVQLRAQSVGDQQIRFNVYIFNIQPGVAINYADGTSRRN